MHLRHLLRRLRTGILFQIPLHVGSLAACTDPAAFLYGDVDRDCVPEFPDCVEADETSAGDPESLICEGVELMESEREEVSCIPPAEDGTCPAADNPCLVDAFEHRFQIDCNDCLREEYRVLCGPDPAAEPDACCYRVGLLRPGCDDG